MKRQSGLTLVEVLVALAIFALLAAASHRLLVAVVDAQRHARVHGGELERLSRAMSLLESDLEQVIEQAPAGNGSPPEPALWLQAEGQALVFTRAGWHNPLQQPRSGLQRVRWQFDAQAGLLRSAADAAAAPGSAALPLQRILPQLDSVAWQFMDHAGQWHAQWPVAPDQVLPRALRLQLQHPRLGALERVFALPEEHGRGPS